jgi:hypothetical protein
MGPPASVGEHMRHTFISRRAENPNVREQIVRPMRALAFLHAILDALLQARIVCSRGRPTRCNKSRKREFVRKLSMPGSM